MATIFVFLYVGCTLAPPDEYDWTIRVWQRCGLMSNYFDQLLLGRIPILRRCDLLLQRSSMFCLSVGLSVGLPCLWAVQKQLSGRDAVWVVDLGGPKEPCIRWCQWHHFSQSLCLSLTYLSTDVHVINVASRQTLLLSNKKYCNNQASMRITWAFSDRHDTL